MISMGTMGELHSHNHTLALYCLSCDRWGEANLDRLIQNGKGNKPVTEARFRCRDCGEIVEKQVKPPVPAVFVETMVWDQKAAGSKPFMECEVHIKHWTSDVPLS